MAMRVVIDTNIFLNRLIDEMTTQMLVEFDAETRFRLRAERGAGQSERALALLDKAAGK